MFPLPVCRCYTWTEPLIAVDKGISKKTRKYSLIQFSRVFVLIFPTVHLTVHYELLDVEPATHGEGVQAAEVQTRDHKMAIKLRSLISLRCDDLDTLVDRQ